VPKLDTSILKRQLEQMIGRVAADNG
jgi:hypothetical protein